MSYFCEKCGSKLDEGVRFCENCGYKVSYNAGKEPESSGSVPTKMRPQQQSGGVEKNRKKEGKNGLCIFLAIVMAVELVVLMVLKL